MAACAYTPALLTKRLTLQAVARTPDGQGGYAEAWADVATVWAQLEPLSGYERMQAQKLDAPLSHKAMIRYRPGLTTAMRAVYQGRVLDIKEVIDVDEARRWLKLRCVETEKILNGVLWSELATNWENIGGTWN